MAKASDEIRRELANTRERVGRTIAALERKVNPRHLLDDHPLAVVGVAFGTGVLLATTGAAKRAAHDVAEQLQHQATHVNSAAGGTLDRLLEAITSTARIAITAKVGEILDSSMRGTQPQKPPTTSSRAA
ncbi:MAG: DUF3618 domain-containing protein [Gemmatimonadaceae bacterium]